MKDIIDNIREFINNRAIVEMGECEYKHLQDPTKKHRCKLTIAHAARTLFHISEEKIIERPNVISAFNIALTKANDLTYDIDQLKGIVTTEIVRELKK